MNIYPDRHDYYSEMKSTFLLMINFIENEIYLI